MATPLRIACFGDSLTEGYGLNPGQALPAVLERMLNEQGVAVHCLNFGVSGDTAGDGLIRLNRVLSASPDAAIVAFGANDCFVHDPISEIRNNLAAILDAFAKRNIPVLLVGIKALTDVGREYKQTFDRIFEELADQYAVPLFPDILSPYFGNPLLKLIDGTHPNADGVEALARALLPHVSELTRQVSSSGKN